MASAVHDTILVCRPEQIREAAIVLSCCPADRFTPLIVMEPPPIGEDEYRRRYEAYVEARNRRDALAGAPLAHLEARGRHDAIVAANDEVDRKAEALTSYRSWWKHQRLVAGLLHTLRLRRAIFLFEPDPNEIRLIDAIPMSRIGSERWPTIPEAADWLYLLSDSPRRAGSGASVHLRYGSLSELTEIAWRACERSGDVPDAAIEVPEAELNAYFDALARALVLGVPIRPRSGTVSDAAPARAGPAVGSPTEAVLIELSADATTLIGVQYAHERKAKLVLYPEPDSQIVERTRASLEQRQDQRLEAGPSSTKFLGRLRDYIFGDPLTVDGIRRLEQAVSAAVPNEVVAAVGGLDLTAFTSGLPYNFVKKRAADWSGKAIGHVTGDPTLLILTELCPPENDAGVGFSLIFDPGFFDTDETRNVLTVLQQRVSYPLVLSGAAGSSLALLQIGPSMPLDVLFFNTHGSDKTIVLSDGALPAFKLVQRQSLPSRPFIFNSSCLSWVGVGREFVRIGARGYVGTLWSVNATKAASYAQKVLQRVIQQGWPVSRAMRRTGIVPSTERAYIFIGTCSARLQEAPVTDADAERRRVDEAITILMEHLANSLERTGGHSILPHDTALEEVLWREAERLLAEYDRHWREPHLDRIDLAILHLRVLSYLVERHPDQIPKGLAVLSEGERQLKTLSLAPQLGQERLSLLRRYAGRLHLTSGAVKRAVELLSGSAAAAEQAGSGQEMVLLELSDALKADGRIPEALDAAQRAHDAYATAAAPSNKRLLAVGRLAQLSSAMRQYDAALGFAREGFGLATELDDLRERAEFKGDESRILLKLERYDEALTEAKVFLDLARQAHDERRELSGYGVIAGALIGLGALAEATDYVEKGLARARTRGFAPSIGDFLMDRSKIKSLGSDHLGALDDALEAAAVFAAIGQGPKVFNALGWEEDQYLAFVEKASVVDSWHALCHKLEAEIALMDMIDVNLRRAIVSATISRVPDLIARAGVDATRDSLMNLARGTRALVLTRPSVSEQLSIVADTLDMFVARGEARFADARDIAGLIDARTGGVFKLVNAVDIGAQASKGA